MTRVQKGIREAKRAAKFMFKNPYRKRGGGTEGLADYHEFKKEVFAKIKRGKLALGAHL